MWPGCLHMSPQCLPLHYRTSWYLKCSYPSSLWRSCRVLFSQFFWNADSGLPRCSTLHLQNSDLMCRTMKPLLNSPHTCCCSWFSLNHYFNFTCFHFLFCSCFGHFRLIPPWAFELGHWSWFLSIFILHDHTLANDIENESDYFCIFCVSISFLSPSFTSFFFEALQTSA